MWINLNGQLVWETTFDVNPIRVADERQRKWWLSSLAKSQMRIIIDVRVRLRLPVALRVPGPGHQIPSASSIQGCLEWPIENDIWTTVFTPRSTDRPMRTGRCRQTDAARPMWSSWIIMTRHQSEERKNWAWRRIRGENNDVILCHSSWLVFLVACMRLDTL